MLPHARDQRAAAGAVDERRHVLDRGRRRRRRAWPRPARPSPARRRRTSPRAASALTALAIPVSRPPPPYGTTTASKSASCSSSSSPIVPLPGHHPRVVDRMDEQAVDALVAPRRRAPATTRRTGTLDHPAAEALDRVELRLRRALRDDDRRRDAAQPRRVGDSLRHVAGARGEHAAARAPSSVACSTALPAPRILNELTGCSVSSLSQISASASTSSRTSGVRTAMPSITSRARADLLERDHSEHDRAGVLGLGAPQHVLGRGEVLDREPERLEDGQLVVGAPARRPRRSGARRSRPGCARARSLPRAAGTGSRPPRSGSTRAGRRRAPRRPSSRVSSSRVVGMLEPTALTCAPSFSHSRREDRLGAPTSP